MKKITFLLIVAVSVFVFSAAAFAGNALLLDDFEGAIVAGSNGTVDAGAGNDSSVEIRADKTLKQSGEQSLKIIYNAVSGGYMWVARGYGLDVKGAAVWSAEPEKINWSNYAAITFYMYGSGSGARMAFDIKDAGGEMLRFMVTDDFKGWKQIVCPFDQFFPRGDWQPPTAETNGKLDFPIKSFQFEPIAVAKGELNIDSVSLI